MTDTSTEAVDALHRELVLHEYDQPNSDLPTRAADTITALRARVEAAEAALATARADALREAAALVDCACPGRSAVLECVHENSRTRWEACGNAECAALTARAILALIDKEAPDA
jgi:hypothetical protein